MSLDTYLKYPRYIQREDTDEIYVMKIEFSLKNLLIGFKRLIAKTGSVLFIIIVFTSFAYLILRTFSRDRAVEMSFPSIDASIQLLPIFTAEFIFINWLLLLGISFMIMNFHEGEQLEFHRKLRLWDNMLTGYFNELLLYIRERFDIILSVILFSVILGVANISIYLGTFFSYHFLSYEYDILLPYTPHELTVIIRLLFMSIYLGRFALAPMIMLREEKRFFQAMEESWIDTQKNAFELTAIIFANLVMAFAIRQIFLPITFIIMGLSYYIINSEEIPLGNIWSTGMMSDDTKIIKITKKNKTPENKDNSQKKGNNSGLVD